MKKKTTVILLSLLMIMAFLLPACKPEMLHASAPIRLKDPWLRWQPETRTGELYLYMTNRSDVDDALIAVSSEAATRIELYSSSPGNITAIEQVSAIELPVESGLILLPGGPHIKLIGMGDTTPGQLIPITMTFEQAGKVSFYVEAH